MDNIKLVIWDLDDTFWKGILSEGEVETIPENINIVKELVDRGIMNAIVSKNDFDKTKMKLETLGVWDYFIFPKISWNPKGEIVKQLLDQCKLRAENTLFIDDNVSNLQEVKFYNPAIQLMNAADLDASLLDNPALKGKDDKSHSRLQQYKILEQRVAAETKYSSNVDFLKDSLITISIEKDCNKEIDRIAELVQRTNQLNFTKNRMSKDELEQLISDTSAECRYIRAHDRFGDYGIVGFYVMKDEQLIHFLFSCRILGLGIENYVYNKLQCPNIEVVGDTACELSKAEVSWISEGKKEKKILDEKKPSILMIGGCDLQQTEYYLSGDYCVDKEFATVVKGVEIRTSDSMQLVQSLAMAEEEKNELCENLPFYDKNYTFSTKVFNGQHDIIIYSVVDDYIRGVFRHKTKGYRITLWGYFDMQESRKMFTPQELAYFDSTFSYEGPENETFFDSNLRFILNNIHKTNPDTIIMLINGNEVDVSDWIEKERCDRNVSMNRVVDSVINDFPNVFLVDMRKIVNDKVSFSKQDNRHYTREVYYKMALEIIRILKEEAGFTKVNITGDFTFQLKTLVKKAVDRISKLFR
ncbi:MAG: HAD-IIIC family phosphatase [Bacteroidales bacterium]|nr:HAD-IIIC family phosphatase [Bacteroidales bacterium]